MNVSEIDLICYYQKIFGCFIEYFTRSENYYGCCDIYLYWENFGLALKVFSNLKDFCLESFI